MTQDFNFDLRLPVNPNAALDPIVYHELTIIYRALRSLAEQVGGGDMIGWTDISESANIVGWSSFSSKTLMARQLTADTMLVVYSLAGTSNSTGVSFLVPELADIPCYSVTGLARNNGTLLTAPAQVVLAQASNIVNVYKDLAGAAWTAAGTKEIAGQFTYKF